MTTPSKAENRPIVHVWDGKRYYFQPSADAIYESLENRIEELSAALSQPVPQEIENEPSGISGELEPTPEEFVFDPYMYDADDGEIIRYKTAEEMIAEVVRVASETNELLSQPVPQGEQSLPPQLVSSKGWIQELRQKAEKAGFGKWTSSEHFEKEVGTEAAVWGSDGDSIALVYTILGMGIYAEDLAPYIAAASPDRILELLSLLDSQQSKLDEQSKDIERLKGQIEAAKEMP